MNIVKITFDKSIFMLFLSIMIIGFGIMAFKNLGRLEDPVFTIKTALIVTPYPGASPIEVEQEVTDVIESAVNTMGEVKEIISNSQAGVSYVYVNMKDTCKSDKLPQIWDELRKKIRDAELYLPPGAGPPIVQDDFGDVYGVFFALHGNECSYAQLKNYAQFLKKELLLCKNVAKIDFWGLQQEAIYIEFNRARMAELGLSMDQIFQTLHFQNLVQQSGYVNIDSKYIRIEPTGDFNTEQKIADLYITSRSGRLVRLGEIALIYRNYIDPPKNEMRYNGEPAIGIGISTAAKGNVIVMSDSIAEKLEELKKKQPDNIKLDIIYHQSLIVTKSVNTFLINLLEAVTIVIALLTFFMGLRSGLLIGVILLMTILATFIGMAIMGISLQKISLGALILALGMLVDNAIVIIDGILVRIIRGEQRKQASLEVVKENSLPLLGATLIAIIAFGAIGFAPGHVGEFCRSLFYVIALSLLLSWIFAVTLAPLFCVWFLKVPVSNMGRNPYDSKAFKTYYKILSLSIKFKVATLILTLCLLAVALKGFSTVPQAFFPPSLQKYFYINYWKPQGTHIDQTIKEMKQIESFVSKLPGVRNVTSFTGEGALRFILSYERQPPNSAYGQLLVEVENYHIIDKLMNSVETWLGKNCPDSEPFTTKIISGPPVTYLIEARFRGPDIKVLQKLAEETMAIMHDTHGTRDIRTDWRQQVRVIQPEFSETQARLVNVSRSDLSRALQTNFNGIAAGVYRENDELIPIIVRSSPDDRKSVENLNEIQIWSSASQSFVPFRQIVTRVGYEWEWPIIRRYNQQRSITVRCNPVDGYAEPLRKALREKIEAIPLPLGYSLKWQGEYNASQEGKEPLKKIFPICILGMFLILVGLFNSIKKSLIIFLTVPLSIIGIAGGLLFFNLPFGFMSILGALGLSGMLIKNAIVLIEQINILINSGMDPLQSVLEASVSRLRPVIMASGTTILGMAPLISEPLFSSMSVTIMGGLLVATFLTLIIVPILYTLIHQIQYDERKV